MREGYGFPFFFSLKGQNMTDKRKELFTAATGVQFILSGIANTIQNPTEELSWKEVEDMKSNIAESVTRITAYAAAVEAYLLDNTPEWAEQWDLANELFAPFNEPYNPEDIDIPTLAASFVERGLNTELAEMMATSVKYPALG